MKWTLNIFLAFVARVLLYILSIPLLVCSIPLSCDKNGGFNSYTRQLALTLDVLGNVLGGPVWNYLFIKDRKSQVVKFGSRYDTMSFVFAMNRHNLSCLGRTIVKLLETLDPGHLNKSVLNP